MLKLHTTALANANLYQPLNVEAETPPQAPEPMTTSDFFQLTGQQVQLGREMLHFGNQADEARANIEAAVRNIEDTITSSNYSSESKSKAREALSDNTSNSNGGGGGGGW